MEKIQIGRELLREGEIGVEVDTEMDAERRRTSSSGHRTEPNGCGLSEKTSYAVRHRSKTAEENDANFLHGYELYDAIV